jgi:hypothetical protein
MNWLVAFWIILMVGMVLYGAYQAFPRELDEDEMMCRLVQTRFQRKLAKVTRNDIDQEIEQAADNLVKKAC